MLPTRKHCRIRRNGGREARPRMSKIVFQQMARECPLSFDQLLARLSTVCNKHVNPVLYANAPDRLSKRKGDRWPRKGRNKQAE